MLMAAFASAVIAHQSGSAWTGLGAGILAAVALSLVHGFAAITWRGNQIVSGVAINMLAAGLTIILGNAWFGQGGRTPSLEGEARFADLALPFAAWARLIIARQKAWLQPAVIMTCAASTVPP